MTRAATTGVRHKLWGEITDLQDQQRATTSTPCREDPELFFPLPGDVLGIAAAKAACSRCPVLGACRDLALERHETDGVWGELSEDERRAIFERAARTRRTRTARQVAA